MKNVSSNVDFTSYTEGDAYIFSIWDNSDEESRIRTRHLDLSYSYIIGAHDFRETRELALDLVALEEVDRIENFEFTIEMPKSFDSSTIGFVNNKGNKEEVENLVYNIKYNTIKGHYKGPIDKDTGIEFRIQLDKGYFNKKLLPFDIVDVLLLLPFTFLIIMFFSKNEKDKWVGEIGKRNKPLEGYSCVEIGFLHKASFKRAQIHATVIDLANKGYIKIQDKSDKEHKYRFSFKRLKDYDGGNITEELIYDSLFIRRRFANEKQDKIDPYSKEVKKEVLTYELADNYHLLTTYTRDYMNSNKENKKS